MKTIARFFVLSIFFGFSLGGNSSAQAESIQGTYKTILIHEANQFHQIASINLRTVNLGDGTLKISANVRIFFGDLNSNEFLTYEFPEVPMNILTRQISLKSDNNDISFIGYLKNDAITGEWFSTNMGRVGNFEANKTDFPDIPQHSQLVKSVTGHYRGVVKNTNPSSNLPERMALSLVTTQGTSAGNNNLSISGNVRFYLGGFDSIEFIETSVDQVQFNFYSRFLTLKTKDYGVTLKGTLSLDGIFTADVFADGLGRVGTAELRMTE